MTARINERQIIFQGRVFQLVKENVTFNNGVTTIMEYVDHPGATAIIPMLTDTRILLLKQYRHALRKHIWEIPAGTLDPAESILECAKRELIEETGYSAEQWQKLAELTPVPGYSNECIHIYLASDLRRAEQNLDTDEIIDVHEFDYSETLEMIKTGKIQDAKTIAGLYLAVQWINGLATQY